MVYHVEGEEQVDLGETIVLDRYFSLLQKGTYRKSSSYYGVYHEIPVKNIELPVSAVPNIELAAVPEELSPLTRGDKMTFYLTQYSLDLS